MTSIMWKRDLPVVVTGAAGFVGAHVTRALVRRGRQVLATDRAPALPPGVTAGLDKAPSYVSGDLRDPDTIARLLAAAAGAVDVMHVAAITRFAQLGRALGEDAPTPAEALASFEVNAFASWKLLTAFAEEGRLRRLVHLSTRAVFGGRRDAGPIAEDEPPAPAGIYGSSKAAAELGVLSLREALGVDAVVARITGAFGPWQGTVSWLGQVVDHVLAGRPYRVSSGRDDAYELTYVKDTVSGLVALLERESLGHGVYHVSSGAMATLGDVAEAVRRSQLGADVSFGEQSALAGAKRFPLAGDRLRDEVGFRPTWNLDDAVADYLRAEQTGEYGAEVRLPRPTATPVAGS